MGEDIQRNVSVSEEIHGRVQKMGKDMKKYKQQQSDLVEEWDIIAISYSGDQNCLDVFSISTFHLTEQVPG